MKTLPMAEVLIASLLLSLKAATGLFWLCVWLSGSSRVIRIKTGQRRRADHAFIY